MSTHTARLVWATPNADATIAYCARVSNPSNQQSEKIEGLLHYCGRHGHWSVFEMANMTVEINTTRDIARQILRHRSLSFQEFSQRYAVVADLPPAPLREARMQDSANRQNSLATDDPIVQAEWERYQREVYEHANAYYAAAVRKGIAKEVARALLPEGLTPSRLYANGTLRSWVHYLQQRTDPATQREHRLVALAILSILRDVAPTVAAAFFDEEAL